MKFEMKLKMRVVFTCIVAGMCLGRFSAFAGAGFGTVTKPANPALQSCIEGKEVSDLNYASDPADCTNNIKSDLKLYQGGTSAANELTGFYDDAGKRCADQVAGSEANCVFKIEAWVTPTCPKDSSENVLTTCKRAETFTIEYQISHFKPLPGMPTFATIKTAVGTDRPNITVPYSAIRASKYGKVDCTQIPVYADEIAAGNYSHAFSVGVDSMGQPICGPDPNQGKINELAAEACKQQMMNLWRDGGTSSAVCDPVKVTIYKDEFPLTQGSYTTTDCRNASGHSRLVDASGTPIWETGQSWPPNLSATYGGRLTGTITDVAAFMTKYGITQPITKFTCQKRDITIETETAYSSFKLPTNYKAGSLQVTLVGGGGGGGRSSADMAGRGGGRGEYKSGVSLSASTECNCAVTVGSYGTGRSYQSDCDGTGVGGGASSVDCGSCGGGSVSAAGGYGGASCSYDEDKHDISNSYGENTYWGSGGGGGSASGHSAGGSGTVAGAGGGGGSSKDCAEKHSGGNGASGAVKAEWKKETAVWSARW